jgi:hypothetical protein
LLYVTTNDGGKTFFNGKMVHGANAKRSLTDGDKIPVEMNEGWNQLMIKQVNWTGGWGARARILSASKGKLEGVKIKAE